MSWVYPQVLTQDHFWDIKGRLRTHGPYGEIETLFAFNPGAYLGPIGGPMPLIRRVGLPALYVNWKDEDWDEQSITQTRVMSAVAGQSEWGEALIARFRQAYADLERDLKPASITHKLRVLGVDSSSSNRAYLRVGVGYDPFKPRAGLRDAREGYYPLTKVTDAERILATDPDLIIQWGERPQDFMNDPRWRGLKAVQERRVYRPPVWWPNPEAILFNPLKVRWLAEVAYPERLKPRVRQLFRDIFMLDFGYQVTDDQIDRELRLEENKNQPGFERFSRDYKTTINRRQNND